MSDQERRLWVRLMMARILFWSDKRRNASHLVDICGETMDELEGMPLDVYALEQAALVEIDAILERKGQS